MRTLGSGGNGTWVALALAAMMSGITADDARAVTDLYRIRLLADRAFIDALRGPLSAECKVAGLRCVDCLGTPCP